MDYKIFKTCCALENFFSVNSANLYIKLIFAHFNLNIGKCRPYLANYLLFFCLKITKHAVFELCCEILIAEVSFRFNLIRKCRSAIGESHCPSTKSKSSFR